MQVAELLRADAAGLARAGFLTSATGSMTSGVGDRVAAAACPREIWDGEAATAHRRAVDWQGAAVRASGRAAESAGAVVADYAEVLSDAEELAGRADDLRVAGEQRMSQAKSIYTAAARTGDIGAARQGIAAYRQGIQSRDAGAAAAERAVSAASEAATETIERLRAATLAIQRAGVASDAAGAERAWTLSDALWSPVTISAGLVNGVVVQPLLGVAKLALAQLKTEWRLLTDPDEPRRLREAALRAAVAPLVFGYRQGEQYIEAAGEGRLGVEVREDAVATFGLVAEVTGIAEFSDGMADGDLFQAASGAGAVVDLVVGSHALGTAADAGRYVDELGDAGRLADIELPVGQRSFREDFAIDDPRLGEIVGAGRDPDRLAAPRGIVIPSDPHSGIVRISSDGNAGTGFIIGVDPAANRTTIATAAHILPSARGLNIGYHPPGSPERLTFGPHRADPSRIQRILLPYDTAPGSRGFGVDDWNAADIAVLQADWTPPEGTFVFPLTGSAPDFQPGQRVFTAGYPYNWTDFRPPRDWRDFGRRREWTEMVGDSGFSVPPVDVTGRDPGFRRSPGMDYFSTYVSPGMGGGPVWTYGPDDEVKLLGINSFRWGAIESGRMPVDTPVASQQPYPELIDPTIGDPGAGGDPMKGGFGNSTGVSRLTPSIWSWLKHQADKGG